MRTAILSAVLLSGCATSYREALPPAPARTPFTFTLTPEQCERLRGELRNYRAVEKTSIYVSGAGALVSTAFLAIPDLRDEQVVQGLGAGVALAAGGVGAFTESQVSDLEKEIALGGCR